MFKQPSTIKTRVFAEIPDKYRKSTLPPGSGWGPGDIPGGCFIEGPSFDKTGSLYIVDIPFGRIFKISPAGEIDLFLEYEGEPNGLKIHRDGRIFVADHKNGLMVADPDKRTIEPVLASANGKAFKGLNDLIFSTEGDLYFTDQGPTGLHDPTGRLFRYSTTGELTCLLDNVPSPNGLVLDRAEQTIFLAVTRDNAIWRVPLTKTGVGLVGKFVQLSGGVGPDGLALNHDGDLLIAHLGLGSVWAMNQRGEPLHRVVSCAGNQITNMAFGGPGNKQLFMTESETGRVLVADMEMPGNPMFSHQA